MLFGECKQTLSIEGIMPERALIRLKRAEIPVFNVKKEEKTRIVLQVKRKDVEKVFAIYPNVCYNVSVSTPYVVKKIGAKGLFRDLETLMKRAGLLLGGLLFALLSLYANTFVFGVDVVGAAAYRRDALTVLEKEGVRIFSPYPSGKEDKICAQILALDGVEFCSVQKRGMRVQVEIRTANFSRPSFVDGDMQAKHTGELVALTVLRGTALKKIGDKITAGETLVESLFQPEGAGQVRVQVIARACIACTYERVIPAPDSEGAFAQAYLELGLLEKDEIQEIAVEEREDGFFVRIRYAAVETLNF